MTRRVLPGNVRVRAARRRSTVVEVASRGRPRPRSLGLLTIVYGFAALIALGTVLLMLPFAARGDARPDFVTALFTSTSAVCVTGLVLRDTHDYWSPFGQVVILVLIQVGGLGFMTGATLMLMLLRRRPSLAQQQLTGETLGALGIPAGALVRRVVRATLTIEAVGAAVLVALFALDAGELTPRVVWRGLFTAVSAFNNAGFDVEGGFRSLAAFDRNPPVHMVVGGLVAIGGIGYVVWSDLATERRWARLSLNTKLVVTASLALWVAGAVAILAIELGQGGALEGLNIAHAATLAGAESIYARTAGFGAFALGTGEDETLLAIAMLMFIGGAAGSTAGGVKLTAAAALALAVWAALRGKPHVTVYERELPWVQINRALAVVSLMGVMVAITAFILTLSTNARFVDVLFETVSAFATCGLSAGITPELGAFAHLVLVVAMFAGRLGPLTLALSLVGRAAPERIRFPREEISIG